MSKKLVNIDGLADFLNTSVKKIQKLRDEGRIPVIDMGERTKRYDVEDVVRALKGQSSGYPEDASTKHVSCSDSARPGPTKPKPICTDEELADYLKASVEEVNDLVADDRIPCLQIAEGVRRFNLESVLKALVSGSKQPKPSEQKLLYTDKELAEFLKGSVDDVDRLVDAGHLPYIDLGESGRRFTANCIQSALIRAEAATTESNPLEAFRVANPDHYPSWRWPAFHLFGDLDNVPESLEVKPGPGTYFNEPQYLMEHEVPTQLGEWFARFADIMVTLCLRMVENPDKPGPYLSRLWMLWGMISEAWPEAFDGMTAKEFVRQLLAVMGGGMDFVPNEAAALPQPEGVHFVNVLRNGYYHTDEGKRMRRQYDSRDVNIMRRLNLTDVYSAVSRGETSAHDDTVEAFVVNDWLGRDED